MQQCRLRRARSLCTKVLPAQLGTRLCCGHREGERGFCAFGRFCRSSRVLLGCPAAEPCLTVNKMLTLRRIHICASH